MIDNYAGYRECALEYSATWINKHNAANLVDMLLAPGRKKTFADF
jgi:hypothetical protein